jgi:GAF domain-containing protein
MQPFESQFAGGSPPFPKSLLRERRSVRHKVHTPAYASLQPASTETVLDLCEILDISERGALLQTPVGWQLGTALDLLLDFSETQTKVHTKGEVVWADAGGRVGVRFPDLSEDARRQLQEWLFLNVMVAAANHAVGIEPPSAQRIMQVQPPPVAELLPIDEDDILSDVRESESAASLADPSLAGTALADPVLVDRGLADHGLESMELNEPGLFGSSRSDYTTTLAALTAVQREVEALGTDLPAALQLIATRASTLTRASGSAIAVAEAVGMVCRASSGDAPPVGTILEPAAGLSGRCLQTGLLQRCDDAERDLRVDREICRELGIRSILAVPVRRGDSVLGLLEVFAPRSYAFGELEASALQRLSETVLAVIHRSGHRAPAATVKPASTRTSQTRSEPKSAQPPILLTPYPFSAMMDAASPGEMSFLRRHLAVLVGIAILILAALAYILVPNFATRIRAPQSMPAPPVSQSASTPPDVPGIPSLDDLRQHADLGDASAQFTLGTRYATGEDVPQDYAIAARWFTQAAEQGLVIAQDTLGNYYWAGRGVPKNITQAYYWTVLARLGGNQASQIRLQILAPQLTPEQARSIERSAAEFFQKHPPIERRDVH